MMWNELVAAMRTLEESRQKRIVVCEVGQGLRVEALVLRYGMDRLWTVRESEHCRPGKILLINDPGPQ